MIAVGGGRGCDDDAVQLLDIVIGAALCAVVASNKER